MPWALPERGIPALAPASLPAASVKPQAVQVLTGWVLFPVQFSNGCFLESGFADEMARAREQGRRGWDGFRK